MAPPSCADLSADMAAIQDQQYAVVVDGQILDVRAITGVHSWSSVVRSPIWFPFEATHLLNILRAIYVPSKWLPAFWLQLYPPWAGCPALAGFQYASARGRAMTALSGYLRTAPGLADIGSTSMAAAVIVGILEDSRAGGDSKWDDAAVAAAAQTVTQQPNTAFDSNPIWMALWRWALGGPAGNATVRTRVFAMKAIEAILRRGSLLPGQIRAADSLAAVLRDQVTQRAPFAAAGAERDLFISEAQATVGAAAAAAVQQELVSVPSPVTTATADWIPVGVATGIALVLGTVAVIAVRHRRAAAGA